MNAPSPLAATFNVPDTGRPLINYVWVNMVKAGKHDGAPECGIDLKNIERAVNNANRYPDADFKIWIDRDFQNDSTLFWLNSFLYAGAQHDNVELCDLRDIPDYADNRFFDNEQSYNWRYHVTSVHARADYARILVLDHCMNQDTERQRILYADMDCEDLRLDDALEIINREGIVTNALGMAGVEHVPSNAYIGINPHDERVKTHFPGLKANTHDLMQSTDGARIKDLGYKSFQKFLDDIGLDYKDETCRARVTIKDVAPHPHTQIPESPLIKELGVCEFNF